MKILIFGASGSGTTTLGKALSKKLKHFVHLDIDDYYWKETDPPFQEKIPLAKRTSDLKQDFFSIQKVIVSGSLVSWGEEWESLFDLAIFLYLKKNIRMQRLRAREKERYGLQLNTNPIIQKTSQAFLEWANQYDDPNFEGRSLSTHTSWMKRLNCEILKLDGSLDLDQKTDKIITTLNTKNC